MNGITESICRATSFDLVDCQNSYAAYAAVTAIALTALATAYRISSSQIVFNWRYRNVVAQIGKGDLRLVETLIEKKNLQGLKNAMMAAIKNGHNGIFKKLISSGMTIPSDAVHLALQQQRINMIPTLIEQCDCNVTDQNGNTPLMIAAKMGDQRSVEKLIKKGIQNLDVQNKEKKTALHLASQEYPKIVQLLLNAGANADLVDSEGKLPLHYAAFQDTEDSVASLLLKTTNLNVQDNEGNTPLHVTIHYTKARLGAAAQLIANPEVNCNLHNKEGELPLVSACYMLDGKDELALKMIQSGRFDLNAFTKNNPPITAAHAAMSLNEKGKTILEALGKAGADFTVEKEGTPSIMAQGFEKKSEIALVQLISMQDPKKLTEFQYRDLSISQWGVVLGSWSVRGALQKKGIYFDGGNEEKMEKEILKIYVQQMRKLFEHSPLKIKEVQDLFEDIEKNPENPRQPFLLHVVRRAINQNIQICKDNDRFRKEGKEIEIIASTTEATHWNLSAGPLAPFIPDGIQQMMNGELPPYLIEILKKLPEKVISLKDVEHYAPFIKEWLNNLIPVALPF